MTYLVVGGLVLLVGLVVVLVALGMRAGRAHDDDDDDWMTDEPQQQRPRRSAVGEAAPGEEESGYDLRVAGAPLAAPVPTAPAAAPRRGKATQEMGDDDYWATITFDKPKFPWQHENGGQAPVDAGAPLHAEPEPEHVAAAADDPFADSYGQGYADQGYVEQGYAEPGYAEQTFADQPVAFAEQPYAEQPYAEQFTDQPFTEQPFSEPAFGEYREDYGDQYREPMDVPVAGHAATFEAEPLPLRPDPLEQSALDWPAPPEPTSPPERSYERTSIDPLPLERPAAPQSDPLGLPDFIRPAAARVDSRDPEATQAYPVAGSRYNSGPINTGPLSAGPRSTGPQNLGPLGGQSPLGNQSPLNSQSPLGGKSPLNTTGPLSPPPLSPPPVSSKALSTSYTPEPQSSGDTDGQRLPTVDELLQKIQADRRKTEAPSTTYNASSLTDPLNDPLASGERDPAYGSSWQKPAPAPSRGYESDPLSGGAPGYGSYGSEGYPSTPAYGEPPRYDDPLAGYKTSTPSTGSYSGSYGESTPEPGRYGDFTGSSFNGTGGDPGQAQNTQNAQTAQNAQNGQTPPGAGGYYAGEQGFYGAPTPEPPSAPPTYPSGPYEKQPVSSEEWDSYRDYRH